MPDELTAAEHLERAILLHQQGWYDRAEAHYRQCLELDPENVRALRLRGIAARDRGTADQSVNFLEHAAQLAPDDPEPLSELALTELAAGRLDAAERSLRRALERDPGSLKALANLGALLQHRGYLKESLAAYRQVLAAEPDDLEIRCNLANALVEAGEPALALAELDSADEFAPGHPMLLATRGAVLCGAGDYAAAIPALEQALAIVPDDDMALTNLGYAHLRRNDLDAAALAYDRASHCNPGNARAAADLVNVLCRLERYDEALHGAEMFLQRFPGERMMLAAQGWALADAGRADQAGAILDYDRLVSIVDIDTPPDYPDIETFNRALADVVTVDPSLQANPVSKATLGGSQTGELRLDGQPVLVDFAAIINAAVASVTAAWSAALPGHPACTFGTPDWTLRCWGTVLPAGGRQVPHLHPLAWVSGVYYAALPEPGGDAHAGWLEFGAPPDRYRVASPPAARLVEPRAGRLVIFPSYFFHRTLPFESEGLRISLAFDAVPVR